MCMCKKRWGNSLGEGFANIDRVLHCVPVTCTLRVVLLGTCKASNHGSPAIINCLLQTQSVMVLDAGAVIVQGVVRASTVPKVATKNGKLPCNSSSIVCDQSSMVGGVSVSDCKRHTHTHPHSTAHARRVCHTKLPLLLQQQQQCTAHRKAVLLHCMCLVNVVDGSSITANPSARLCISYLHSLQRRR